MSAIRRISDVVKIWAEKSPDHPALVEASYRWTYKQLATALSEAKNWLAESGVRPGDRVMLVCENSRELIALLLALTDLDAWPVLVNAHLAPEEVDKIRQHSGARLVIYTTSISPVATKHAKRDGATITEIGGLGAIGVGAINEATQSELVEVGSPDNIAALIYTSGTTGIPKGVMLTHRNLLFMADGAAGIRSIVPKDRVFGVLPMSHAVGLSVVMLGTLLRGATLYVAPRFDPISGSNFLVKEGITIFLGVPAMFVQLIQYAKLRGFSSLRFPELRIIASSGAPLQQSVKTAVENLIGLVLHNGYGVTECSPTIAQTRIDEPRTDVSVGRAFPGVQIKIVGANGTTLPDGEIGELRVRGPNIMKGYYKAPEETAAVIDSEGWFNTRDLAKIEEGNVFIVGRAKEMIVHLGLNVYPIEVEAVLNTHPAVLRSAVIGRPIQGDEEILAFVQLNEGASITPNELSAFVAGHLASYKRPNKIVIVPELQTTPTGKVIKAGLSKLLLEPSPAQ
ncbi:MAG TPA: AMP-binding protein [Terriglobales bacterium]|nr:AMP-binding protein [Terriglobales bacterium]